MLERLIQLVKRKCNITWDDEDTNARIEEIVTDAIPELIHRLGIADPEFDFTKAGTERNLFRNYCFYEFNHCLNEFWVNYADDIAQVRAKNDVENHLASEENSDEQI